MSRHSHPHCVSGWDVVKLMELGGPLNFFSYRTADNGDALRDDLSRRVRQPDKGDFCVTDRTLAKHDVRV